MNYLVHEKVSAVSPKEQTTRQNTLAVLTHEDVQIEFYDTPGVINPKNKKLLKKNEDLVKQIWETLKLSDMVMILVDVNKNLSEMMHVFDGFKEHNKPKSEEDHLIVIAVVNKVEMVEREVTDGIITQLEDSEVFDEVFRISARTGYGIDVLKEYLYTMAPLRKWKHKPEVVTTLTKEERAVEIIREKLYRRLNRELPYDTDLKLTKFEEHEDSFWIDMNFYVNTTGKAKILVSSLPYIQERGALDLEKILKKKIHLKFKVIHTKQ